MMFTLPERLRELRISHGYQQADVAAVLGVIRQTYSHYENGKRVPSAATLKKLADLYQIRVDDLIPRDEHSDPDLFYDLPDPSKDQIFSAQYLAYIERPENQARLRSFSVQEKKMLCYFEQLNEADKEELIEFAQLKLHRYRQKKDGTE